MPIRLSSRPALLVAAAAAIASLGCVGCRAIGDADAHGSPDDVAVGTADGKLPDGVTVFDDGYPGVANLDPRLLKALREATDAARADGVELVVNSGWRSRAYQRQLLADAVAEHGSRDEAARWVATPSTSPHVAGDAVDIGGADATAWLAEHGAQFGLCRVYGNEPWHVELRPQAEDAGCPPPYTDPTQDPRMLGDE